jgi:hypothetical protein
MRASSISRCGAVNDPSSAYQPMSEAKTTPPTQTTDRPPVQVSSTLLRNIIHLHLHLSPNLQPPTQHRPVRCVLYLICRGPSKTALDRLITLVDFHSTLECPKSSTLNRKISINQLFEATPTPWSSEWILSYTTIKRQPEIWKSSIYSEDQY